MTRGLKGGTLRRAGAWNSAGATGSMENWSQHVLPQLGLSNPVPAFSGAAKRTSGIGAVFWGSGVARTLRLAAALLVAVARAMPGERE